MCFCQIIWSVEKDESLSWHEGDALFEWRRAFVEILPSLFGEKENLREIRLNGLSPIV